MATLLAIGYADQDVAEIAQKSVQELEDELLLTADHVAAIARDIEGRYHARISHTGTTAPGGVDWGGFWSGFFGLLFFVPGAGLALRPEQDGNLGEESIDLKFLDKVREQLKPGTSAVFLMVDQASPEKAVGILQRYGGTIHETSLSNAEFGRLRKALARAASAPAAGSGRPLGRVRARPSDS
jgi:uncharacterized membrane protein